MYPTGTKFKTKDGKKWEITQKVSNANKFLFYRCVCKDKPIYVFKDFKECEMEGVELI